MKRCVIGGILIAVAVPGTASAQQLTVYSSLPLSGASRVQTKAVNAGARQALREAGGQAGGRSVRLVTLNDATRRTGAWTPGREAQNARRAARDDSTVAYIGAFNSGASQVSIPILNEAGIPQVSPSNTYTGLTVPAQRGEPDRYYPTGIRTYFRIVPNDTVQAAALVTAMRDRGCTRVAAVHDNEVYGAGMNRDFNAAAQRLGLPIVANRAIGRRTRSFRAITRARPDCVVYTGLTANGAVRLFRSVGRGRRMFGSDGVAEAGFTRRLPRSIARRTLVSVATLAPEAYPGGAAIIGRGDPYKIYGYEAMKVILDAINAGGPSRQGVLNGLRGVQNRNSVLGTYSFDANGDTTLRTYGLYSIQRRALVFEGVVTAG
jgi:branched-chain amino acid transport system substrate-binding protein